MKNQWWWTIGWGRVPNLKHAHGTQHGRAGVHAWFHILRCSQWQKYNMIWLAWTIRIRTNGNPTNTQSWHNKQQQSIENYQSQRGWTWKKTPAHDHQLKLVVWCKKNWNHSPASSVVASCKAARPSPCIEMVPAAQQSWQGKLAQICGTLVLDCVHHLTAIEKTRSQTMRQAGCLRFKSIKNSSLAQTCCVRCWREWRSSTTRVCVHDGWDTHSNILGLSTCDGGSHASFQW